MKPSTVLCGFFLFWLLCFASVPLFALQDGAPAQLWTCVDPQFSENQQWIVDQHTGQIRIRDRFGNQQCLDVSEWGSGDRINVQVWACHGRKNQQFVLDHLPHIISKSNGKCLTVDSVLDGSLAFVENCSSSNEMQDWKIQNGNTTIVRHVASGKCLDVGSYLRCWQDPIRSLPFCNTSLALEPRLKDLLSRMTLEEKMSQMLTGAPPIARLGIPAYNWWSEALHGVADGHAATSFPQVIGLGASFDMDLVREIAQVISTEARAINNMDRYGLTFFAPNINIFRDPRWGRGQETPGEDPYLSSRYAVTFVKALQEGEDPRCTKVVATCKHFAAYSLENSDGFERYGFDAIVDDYDLVTTYLRAFKACVTEGKARSIMCSYNSINHIPACANDFLQQEIARGQWEFRGYIVSDCDAVANVQFPHNYTKTPWETCAATVRAGTDLDCGSFYGHLAEAIAHKTLEIADIDRAVSRLFYERFALGMFDGPDRCSYQSIGPSAIDTAKARELALRAAQKSIVLLKNEASILPLSVTGPATRVAVIGPNANDSFVLLGNYQGQPPFVITPLQAIQDTLGPDRVVFAKGCEVNSNDTSGFAAALSAVRNADVAVLFLGLNGTIENEGNDRRDIGLPGVQNKLALAIQATGIPTVLVLLSGGPVAIDELASRMNAIVAAFYPGQSGGRAIADVLFGFVNPGGKLPITFYKQNYPSQIKMSDMSMRHWPGRTYRFCQVPVLWEFGFGLSYTRFNVTWISASVDGREVFSSGNPTQFRIRAGQTVIFHALVKNIGNRTGDEVVQAYFSTSSPPSSSGLSSMEKSNSPQEIIAAVALSAPLKELFGFSRVTLRPGEQVQVFFSLSAETLAQPQNEDRMKTVIKKGRYKVTIGEQHCVYFLVF